MTDIDMESFLQDIENSEEYKILLENEKELQKIIDSSSKEDVYKYISDNITKFYGSELADEWLFKNLEVKEVFYKTLQEKENINHEQYEQDFLNIIEKKDEQLVREFHNKYYNSIDSRRLEFVNSEHEELHQQIMMGGL